MNERMQREECAQRMQQITEIILEQRCLAKADVVVTATVTKYI